MAAGFHTTLEDWSAALSIPDSKGHQIDIDWISNRRESVGYLIDVDPMFFGIWD